jgi:predicted Fe-S protein YdhL (DUF1289 family)
MPEVTDTTQSPCIGVCRLNHVQVCVGCGRTGNEIAEWLAASDKRRAAIRLAASARMKSLQPMQPAVSHE